MYIVTGGAGFLGSALIWKMNRMGIDNILVVDHLGEDDKWKNLRGLHFFDYMEKDAFRTMIADKKLESGIEAIIHLGACSSTTETDASFLIDNNFNYSKELAKFAVSREIRFIYASSAATYGDGSEIGYVDDEAKIERLRPLNIYGYSKHLFDLWVKNNGLFKVVTGLKFTNVFGPNEYHKEDMRSVVNKAYHQVKSEGVIRLFRSHRPDFADGEQKRDFLYVKDAIEMIAYFLESYDGGLFNVGSGVAETWNNLAEAVFDALHMPRRIEYFDMPKELRGRYQYYTRAEMEKLRGFGYGNAMTPLAAGVRDYVIEYLEKGAHLGDESATTKI
jgi:ADP-L-glycero-D-manno-heptose 6-epimerase